MSEREMRDFMSVDRFSQLPFIRATTGHNKPPAAASGIRLFGFEFPHEPENPSCEAESFKDPNTNTTVNTGAVAGGGGEGSSRKFECHYCCRNFPTSQALGGHQNAHKRERQHAKRMHLQSAMAAPPSALRFAFEPPPPSPYPSWSTTGPRFYSGFGSVSQPINGSPLPGFWRLPTATMPGSASIGFVHPDRSPMVMPWLADHEPRVMGVGGVLGVGSVVATSSASPHGRRVCEPMPSSKDGVSLDLRL